MDVGPFSKILGPGPPEPPGLMLPYTKCRNGAQTGQTGFTMPLSRLLVSGIFQSLRVAGAPFEAPF